MERNSPRQEADIMNRVALAQSEITGSKSFAVDSETKVEVHLKPQSLVPTKVHEFVLNLSRS